MTITAFVVPYHTNRCILYARRQGELTVAAEVQELGQLLQEVAEPNGMYLQGVCMCNAYVRYEAAAS